MSSKAILTFDEVRDKLVSCLRLGCNGEEQLAIQQIQQIIKEKESGDNTGESRSSVDQAFRDVLKELIHNKHKHCSGNDVEIEDLTRLVRMSTNCARSTITSVSLPFILLVDIFDCLTLPVCQRMFIYVEGEISTWKDTSFYTVGKNYILRMCNDLLRRLSRSQDTIFCGQIRLFLSRYFPLDERSGLNVMSHFNVDNVTFYVKPEVSSDGQSSTQPSQPDESVMEIEDGEISEGGTEEKKVDKSKAPIDYNLYYKFWSLQDLFSNPTLCYSNSGWNALTTSSRIVLDVFKSYKLEATTHKRVTKRESIATDRNDRTVQSTDSDGNEMQEQSRYFAKFLTNEKLLDLQLNDSKFRRVILIQFLILFQYLTSNVKFRSSSYTMSERQLQWIERSTQMIYQLLEESPPEGKIFAQSVREILTREEHWNKWKNDGCPNIVQVKVGANGDGLASRKKRKIGRFYANSVNKLELGNAELTRLWNLSADNMSACKVKDTAMPTLEEFFEEAIEQADPEAQVEDEYKLVNNVVFRWRAFRYLAVESPIIFPTSSSTASSTASKTEFLAQAIVDMAMHSKDRLDSAESENITADEVTLPLNIKDIEEEDKLTDPE